MGACLKGTWCTKALSQAHTMPLGADNKYKERKSIDKQYTICVIHTQQYLLLKKAQVRLHIVCQGFPLILCC